MDFSCIGVPKFRLRQSKTFKFVQRSAAASYKDLPQQRFNTLTPLKILSPCFARMNHLSARSRTSQTRTWAVWGRHPHMVRRLGNSPYMAVSRIKPERNTARWRCLNFLCANFLKLACILDTKPTAGTLVWPSISTASVTAFISWI